MLYTVYKITNKINGKYYIGMHKTKDLNDGYMGSGKLIRRAIDKYGIENFSKEILHVFDNEEDMKNKEKELVVLSEDSYNLCPGGHGGFGYLNVNGLNISELQKEHARKQIRCNLQKLNSGEYYDVKIKALEKAEKIRLENNINGFRGKRHSEETLALMRSKKQGSGEGENNSQYGTCWVTDGLLNKKIKKSDDIPEGFRLGRILLRAGGAASRRSHKPKNSVQI